MAFIVIVTLIVIWIVIYNKFIKPYDGHSEEFGVYQLLIPTNPTEDQRMFMIGFTGNAGPYRYIMLNETIAMVFPIAFKIEDGKLFADEESFEIKDNVAILNDDERETFRIKIKDDGILEMTFVDKREDKSYSLEVKRIMDLSELFGNDPCNGRIYKVKLLISAFNSGLSGDGKPFPAIVKYCKEDQTVGLMKVDGSYHTKKIINGEANLDDILPKDSPLSTLILSVDADDRITLKTVMPDRRLVKFIELVDVTKE